MNAVGKYTWWSQVPKVFSRIEVLGWFHVAAGYHIIGDYAVGEHLDNNPLVNLTQMPMGASAAVQKSTEMDDAWWTWGRNCKVFPHISVYFYSLYLINIFSDLMICT